MDTLDSVPILHNSRNNCWFNCSLTFLGQAYGVRIKCRDEVKEHSLTFGCKVAYAILAGSGLETIHHVDELFQECKDFAGRGNRYRQLSVPDFISLCAKYRYLIVLSTFRDCLYMYHLQVGFTSSIARIHIATLFS